MRPLLVVIAILFLFSSCKVLRPSLMLKTPKDYSYTPITDTLSKLDYRMAPTDIVQYRIFSNDGFKLIDLTMAAGSNVRNDIDATVDQDGNLKLPLLGKIKVQGLSLREAESLLEEKYTEFYVKPYVQLKILNKRVIVFPGNAGAARVVTIANNNTTVFEALALAGGLTEDGKAYRVKLIRNAQPKPEVYLMDLSTIDGLAAGNTIVLANDIIYVEPRVRVAQRVSAEIAPYMTVLSSLVLIFAIFKK